MNDRLAVSVKTAAFTTDLSEATIRDAINKKQLPAFKVGRSPRIFISDLRAWLKSRPAVGSEDA